MPHAIDWSALRANGTYSLNDGANTVAVTIVTTQTRDAENSTSTAPRSSQSPVPGLWLTLQREPVEITMDFDTAVANISFNLFGMDVTASGLRRVAKVIALDANGHHLPVQFSEPSDNEAASGAPKGTLCVAIASGVCSITVIFGHSDTVEEGGLFGVSNMSFDALDVTKDDAMRISYEHSDDENAMVEFVNKTGFVTGSVNFRKSETASHVPCFTAGTLISTLQGQRPVESLKSGDRVITRDNGVQKIRWVGQSVLSSAQLRANPNLQPVRIAAGAMGYGLPERDLVVSPHQRMLIANYRAEMMFGKNEVLVAAAHLDCLKGVSKAAMEEVLYVHLMFDQHEIIMAEGSWTESYLPSDKILEEMEIEQQEQLYSIFPELRQRPNHFVSARMGLEQPEALALLY